MSNDRFWKRIIINNFIHRSWLKIVYRSVVNMSNILLNITDYKVESQQQTNKPLFVSYYIKCSYRNSNPSSSRNQESYTVVKRYSELLELHKKIMKQFDKKSSPKNSQRNDKSSSPSLSDEGVKFPGKMLFGNFKVGCELLCDILKWWNRKTILQNERMNCKNI